MLSRRWTWALIVALIPLLGFWAYGLFDLDEGFYAAVTAEMNRRHDWITPYFNGQPWFEKPILLYWLAAPSLALFGEAIGPRLPSVLASLGLFAACGAFMARLYDAQTARWAVIILGSSLLVVAVGRMMMTDALLNLALSACLILFFQSTQGDRRWRMAASACLGLAVLAKGPVAAILFVLIASIGYWRIPELRPGFRGFWIPSTLVFFAIVALWYVPCSASNGELFVQRFLIEQNIGRFTGGDAAHTIGFFKGLPIYPLTLLVGMAPWIFFSRSAWSMVDDTLARFLKVWFLVIFVFFLVSGAKLPHYILPAATPLALLIATRLGKTTRTLTMGYASVVVVFIVAHFGFAYYYGQGHAEIHRLAKAVQASSQAACPVMVYQMPRREKDLGTGSLHLRETSHPSLLLYLDRTVADVDTDEQFEAAIQEASVSGAPGLWILTRNGRLSEASFKRLKIDPAAVEGRFEPWVDYACWFLDFRGKFRASL